MLEYNRILDRLKNLPSHIIISKLEETEIEERSIHTERSAQWAEYLNEKMKLRKYSDLKTMYIAEQEQIFETAKKQSLPYSIIDFQ